MFSGTGVALHFGSPLTASRIVTIRTIGLTLLALFAGVTTAAALSQEQAVASCRESVGRPIVQACMRSMGGGGANREANLVTCRAGVSPQVKACVMAALNKANGRANVAIELVKPKDAIIAPGNSLPAGFVAPSFHRRIWRNFIMTAATRARCWAAARMPWPMLKRLCLSRVVHPIRCFSIASGNFSVSRSRRRAI